ncbi:MAG: hypothetical protein AAFP19_06025 [Bacteroidota bacterium]
MKRFVLLIVATILGFLSINSCQLNSNGQRNIQSYYYPMKVLEKGLVYEYTPVGNDSLTTEYWYYRTFEEDSAYYFTGQYYDYRFNVQQFFTEEVVDNGTLMRNYFFYPTDSTGKQVRYPANIEVPNVFPFYITDTLGVFLYRISWRDYDNPAMTTTLVRNRRYKGDSEHHFNGKTYDCIDFAVKELVETELEGYQEIQYDGLERYAEGVGLVYYRKALSRDFVLEYELTGVYPMEDLEEKFGAFIQEHENE